MRKNRLRALVVAATAFLAAGAGVAFAATVAPQAQAATTSGGAKDRKSVV